MTEPQTSSRPSAPPVAIAFSMRDRAAGEKYPAWPGPPMTVPSGMPGLATIGGEGLKAPGRLALPLASLERLAVGCEIRHLGAR